MDGFLYLRRYISILNTIILDFHKLNNIPTNISTIYMLIYLHKYELHILDLSNT